MSYHQSTLTDYLQIALKYKRRYISHVDMRIVRKAMLATMFVVVAHAYISQIISWGLFGPLTSEDIAATATVATTLMAAIAGAVYLWRAGISHPIEITVVALIVARFVQQTMIPVVYSWDIARGEIWYIFAYAMYTIALLLGYIVSTIFFVCWRTRYRNKLIVVGVLLIVTIIIEMTEKAQV